MTYSEQPEADQFAGVLEEEEDEATWLYLDAPHKGEEVSEASKSIGKESDQPTPAQAEGGAIVPPAENPYKAVTESPQAPTNKPQDPQAGTCTDNPQDPTDKPQDPQANTSTDDPGLKENVDSYMQAAQDWFDKVQENKEEAYKELFDTVADREPPP